MLLKQLGMNSPILAAMGEQIRDSITEIHDRFRAHTLVCHDLSQHDPAFPIDFSLAAKVSGAAVSTALQIGIHSLSLEDASRLERVVNKHFDEYHTAFPKVNNRYGQAWVLHCIDNRIKQLARAIDLTAQLESLDSDRIDMLQGERVKTNSDNAGAIADEVCPF